MGNGVYGNHQIKVLDDYANIICLHLTRLCPQSSITEHSLQKKSDLTYISNGLNLLLVPSCSLQFKVMKRNRKK